MPSSKVLRVLVIGARGHARVCLEALLDDPRHDILGAVSRDGRGVDGLGIPILGTDSDFSVITESGRVTTGFVAIGDNRARAEVTERWRLTGLPLTCAISRHAAVSQTATVADGAAVLPGAVVNAATEVGRGAIVNTNASVDHDCRVGEFAHIAPGVAIGGGVEIGEGAFVALGARVIPGISIGSWAVVGAGTVVIRDVSAGAVVVGNPARPIRRRGV